MATPTPLATAEDALRWRSMFEAGPTDACLVEFRDGDVWVDDALDDDDPDAIGWRPLPTPAGDAAIAAELERLRAEVERLKGTSVELFDEARHSQQKRFAAEVERDEARAERDALRAENARLRADNAALALGQPGHPAAWK